MSARFKGNAESIWSVSSVWFILLVLFNQINETNQTNQIAPTGVAGGGFQHRLVDSHQVFLRLVTTRCLFTGELGPLPHGHAGTSIALCL